MKKRSRVERGEQGINDWEEGENKGWGWKKIRKNLQTDSNYWGTSCEEDNG